MRPGSSWAPLLAVGLLVAGAAFQHPAPLPTLAGAALLLAFFRRGSQRGLVLAGVAAVLLEGAAQAHLRIEAWREARAPRSRLAAALSAAEERKRHLVALLDSLAARVAGLREVRGALAGDRAALSTLFIRLAETRQGVRERPALAVHAVPLSTVAWSGRVADLRAFQGIAGVRRDVFVLAGSVTTTLVSTVPVLDGAGRTLGLATAELPVAVRRNISNEYLADFDLLAQKDPGIEIHYLDARYEAEGPRPFAPLPPGVLGQEALLLAPDGGVLAAIRATSTGAAESTQPLRHLYDRGLSAVAGAALLAWMLARPVARSSRRLRLAAGATALRLVFLVLGPPFPHGGSRLLSPDTYASTVLGALTRSPLDLLLTTLWVATLAALLLERVLATAPRPSSPARAYPRYALALPVLAGLFAWIDDTASNCSLDVEALSLVPPSVSHLVLQTSLLLILASGALLLLALLVPAGALPTRMPERLERILGCAVLGTAAFRAWPRDLIGLPLVPALALFLIAAVLAGRREQWLPILQGVPPGLRAGVSLAAVALLALLLYPTLVHFGEKGARQQIERDYAPLVLRQPEWREYVLAESRRRIDALNLLEDTAAGPNPPLIEELAFGVWSLTDLASFGFSSAVEIQDPAGRVVSRFALNLPSLSGPIEPLPSSPDWETARESLPLASGGERVLHARRLLYYHGEVHGAVHVYVKDDFWNLPFVRGPDPYSVLYRTASRGATRDRPVGLLAYDWSRTLVFSSSDRPPALDPALVARLRGSPPGVWTTLLVDGRLHHTFLFSDGRGVYGLTYPRLGAGRFAADLVEAASGLTLVALTALLLLVLLRTALGRPTLSVPSLLGSITRRFALRLFVAFTALAFVPVVVLEVVVRGFVAERLRKESEDDALERATVAKKAVEDFVLFRRGEAAGREPGLDAGLVYIASLMRIDLDVFAHGSLLASSKRELYASGLLPPRVSASVFRALVLEGQPSALTTERIGGFSYLVTAVPVRLEGPEPGILSIPLALRQREVEAVLEDLDRTIRLASVLFLVVAAALAQSVARRISDPIRALTRATQRVAHGDLSARVTTASRDELLTLVESFNQMARDLDQQRRDLERSNRLAAWAEMARQVAHEVKNPLTPIQLSAEHLRRVYGDAGVDFSATLESCTQTILRQVRTLRGIVTEFSAFARPPAAQLEPESVAGILAEALRPYQGTLPPGVTLSVQALDGAPPVLADRRLLERAVVNLVENALHAVGERGAISVCLRAVGERIEVEVEDSGPGIDPEIRERVFEPFFSTKTGGSGLGLALVKKIAEDHGGGVALESQPGRTRVRLWLPVARG